MNMAAPSKHPTLLIDETDSKVSDRLCTFIATCSRETISERGVFTIGLSGMYTLVISVQNTLFNMPVKLSLSICATVGVIAYGRSDCRVKSGAPSFLPEQP